ncbi:hypothetical protein DHEL01_v208681 [Diaporthe helianthi]|uniref:Uncharacterized protein n=1 Tax=Diaporthe helianthi TaxID=158607 RepID=A0A2P5HRV1_DIAHE|nr:hypothetical protein DHEL01_v208681 [Diaporthe helianthi]
MARWLAWPGEVGVHRRPMRPRLEHFVRSDGSTARRLITTFLKSLLGAEVFADPGEDRCSREHSAKPSLGLGLEPRWRCRQSSDPVMIKAVPPSTAPGSTK